MKSIVSYPERGPWGNARYRGNCSGHLIADLIREFKPKRFADPMLGGGTSKDVCRELGIPFWGSDLRDGFDLTQDDVPVAFDFAFAHPPYSDIVKYSGNIWGTQPDPRDLSQCATYEEFLDKLDDAQFRVYDALRGGGILAVLIGDVRKQGVLYPISRDTMACHLMPCLKHGLNGHAIGWYGNPVAQVIKVQHNLKSAHTQYSGSFIELAHEYLVLTHKPKGWAIPVRVTQVASGFDRARWHVFGALRA